MKLLSIVSFVLLISCEGNLSSLPTNVEVESIAKRILKVDEDFTNRNFNFKLFKVDVVFYDSLYRPQNETVRFNRLLSFCNGKGFTSQDSMYVANQNLNTVDTIPIKAVLKRRTKSLFTESFISIPIFTKNKHIAYVEVVHKNAAGGFSDYYILEKKQDEWEIIESGMVWIS